MSGPMSVDLFQTIVTDEISVFQERLTASYKYALENLGIIESYRRTNGKPGNDAASEAQQKFNGQSATSTQKLLHDTSRTSSKVRSEAQTPCSSGSSFMVQLEAQAPRGTYEQDVSWNIGDSDTRVPEVQVSARTCFGGKIGLRQNAETVPGAVCKDTRTGDVHVCPAKVNDHEYQAMLRLASSCDSSRQVSKSSESASLAEEGSIPSDYSSATNPHPDSVKVPHHPRLELHPLWSLTPQGVRRQSRRICSAGGKSLSLIPEEAHNGATIRFGDVMLQAGLHQRIVLRPHSGKRLFWDLLTGLFLFYDVITIPLQAFDMPAVALLVIVAYASACIWTVDLALSFCTGYEVDGYLEMRPPFVTRNFIKTWFVPDVLVVVIDWLLIVMEGVDHSGNRDNPGVLRLSKSNRVLRILRLLRLMRLTKAVKLKRKLLDNLSSMWLVSSVRLWRLILYIVLMNHYVACGWYALHRVSRDAGWVRKYQIEGRGVLYEYLSSLHWSITQITPASMEINPTNEWERLYTICVLLFGLVVFSSFVSSVTTTMTSLWHLRHKRLNEELMLRQFLTDQKISRELGVRARKYFRENGQKNTARRTIESDVKFLVELPTTMLVSLHTEMYMPALTLHPLLMTYKVADKLIAQTLCHRAAKLSSYGVAEHVFAQGTVAMEMYFVVWGRFAYFHERDQTGHHVVGHGDWVCDHHEVGYGVWLCEGALWCATWRTHGRLEASIPSELVSLDARKFRALMIESVVPMATIQQYAGSYIQRCNRSDSENDFLLDICVSVDSIQQMVNHAFHDNS